MANIFISYARADRKKVERLAAALENAGFSLWWDREIKSGAEFSACIERELEAAKHVIVCWSRESVKSHWVKDEAMIAARANKLKAVSLDGTEPPIGYMQYHALDFCGWQGVEHEECFSALLQALGATPVVKPTSANSDAADDQVSLIVLPFQTISTDPADQVLSIAIHEDLTTQLARVKDYFVISRSTAVIYGQRENSPADLHKELGVSYALEGSVRRAGEDIRVTAQLIDTASGGCMAALRFDRPAAELMGLQNDLIAEIVNHLGSEINFAEVRRLEERAAANPSAVNYFSRARMALAQSGWNKKTVVDASILLEKAIEIDPEFAPAISQLALLKGLSLTYGFFDMPEEALKEEVITLANKAISIDRQSTDVLGFAGCALCDVGELDRGVEHLQRATEIDPSNAQALAAYGFARILQKRFDEGVPMMEAAIRISPKAPGLSFWMYGLSIGLEAQGKTDEAYEALERTIRLDPTFTASYPLLASLAVKKGDRAYAKELIARAKEHDPGFAVGKMETAHKRNIKSIRQEGLTPPTQDKAE